MASATSKKLRTPRGKLISVARYCALVSAMTVTDRAMACVDGHLGCAAWNRGPCSAELGAVLDAGQEDA